MIRDIVAVCFDAGALRWDRRGQWLRGPRDGALLVDVAEYAGITGTDGSVLLVPARVLPGPLKDREATVLDASAELATLRRLVRALMADESGYDEAQAMLIGSALVELLTAVLTRRDASALLIRRNSGLFDRLSAHIDAHLTDDLDLETLCRQLRCSRSAIYRATAPIGGIATLIRERRLRAIYRRLGDPDEQETIAALGRAYGFVDAANLNERFRRRFGITARQLRRDRARTVEKP